ncbi:MAG: VOC family protein [Vicinamibacterales bacterium]
MPGPARAGILVYAKDLSRLAAFYADVLGGVVVTADPDHQVIATRDQQVVVHAIPPAIAETITIDVPPVLREDAVFKPFFTVDSLAAARERAHHLGGGVFEEEWRGPGFVVRNAFDCEGNIVQLRELTA